MSAVELMIASPPDRDRVVAQGFVGDEQLFELANEPTRHFALEIYPRRDGEPWRLPIDELTAALAKAREKLDYPAARSEW